MFFIPKKVNIFQNFARIFRLMLCWEDTIGINGMPSCTTELFYYFGNQHCLNTSLCRSFGIIVISDCLAKINYV